MPSLPLKLQGVVVLQNDMYRLKILIPLLELLHHHVINQDDIQNTAFMVGKRFAPYLLRPARCDNKQTQEVNLAIAAATAMILDYRSLFSNLFQDIDRHANKHMCIPCGSDIPRHRPTSLYAAVSYPMPLSPKSVPAYLQHISNMPEGWCKSSTDLLCTNSALCNGSPKSDDLESAVSMSSCFSICSHDAEQGETETENSIDSDLAAAVDSLFCASTSQLLIPV